MPAFAPLGPSFLYSSGLMGPRFPWLTWVARARMPLNSGAACEVPSEASMVMSGTDRIGLPVMFATPFW
jgi:hypothetical protein